MTDKEYTVEYAKDNVKNAESRLRESKKNLEEGYKKGQAQVEQLKSEVEREYYRLKEEVARAQNSVDINNKYLQSRETDLARGFDQ